jgi:hypothetical protein
MLVRGIGGVLHLLREAAAGGFGRHLDHVACHVHFPAVVEATQPAILVAAKYQRGAAMRAVAIHHAHAPIGIAEGD